MKVFTFRFLAIALTFVIGIWAVEFWILNSQKHYSNFVSESLQSASIAQIKPANQQIQFEPAPLIQSKIESEKAIPIEKHESFNDVVLALKRMISFMSKSGEQTFFISDVRFDDGEYAYAFWKQDNSIIILHLPFDGEPSESELYWLRDKARIDLKNVVPNGKYENLGCCMIEKDFADKILTWCKNGYKLKVKSEKK